MTNPSNIHSLHGRYFSAEICFEPCFGRISVHPNTGFIYLCQDVVDGSGNMEVDRLGYRWSWFVGGSFDGLSPMDGIVNLKILPSPIEYHALFQEILAKRGPTWSEAGSYSVIPNEVLAKIQDFMDRIKELDVKNPGNNQNQL